MLIVLLAAALADPPSVTPTIEPRFLPQSSASSDTTRAPLAEKSPVTHPF